MKTPSLRRLSRAFGTRHFLIGMGIAALLILSAFPLFGPEIYYLRLLSGLFMFIGLAESWNLVGGYTGYLSLGHVTFYGVGAYTSAVLLTRYGISPFLVAPLAGVFAVVVALITGYPALRLRGPYFAITTLAIAFLAQISAANIKPLGKGMGIIMPAIPLGVTKGESVFYWVLLAIAGLVVFVAYKLEHSRMGLGLVAIRDDETVAEVFGINVVRAKLATYALSAFFPGMIGAIRGYQLGYIEPNIAFSIGLSIDLVVMTLFGGRGRWAGPIVGASIVYLLSQTMTFIIPGELNRVLFGLILVIVIFALPGGVLGLVSRRRRSEPIVTRTEPRIKPGSGEATDSAQTTL